MTDNSFDDFIKDRLKDHSSPVPADMWDRIRPQKDDRRGAFLFGKNGMMLILIFVGILGGWLLWNNDNSPVVEGSQSASSNEQEQTTKSLDIPTEEASKNNGSNSKEEASPSQADISTTPDNSLGAGSQDNDLSTSNSRNFTDSDIKNNKEEEVGRLNKVIKSRGNRASINLQANKSNVEMLNSENSQRTASTGDGDVFSNEYSLSDFNKYQLTTLSLVAREQDKLRQLQVNPELLSQLNNYNLACLVDCPTSRGGHKSNLFVEVFASADYAKKSIDKDNSISENYFRRKDSTERFKGAFTAGVRLSKSIGENLMIKTGAQFSQINEKFSFRSENERRLVTVVTIRTIIRNPGDTITVRDTSTVEQIGYRVRTTHNRYRSIDIPVILSYEWGGEKLRASVNAGVVFNLYSWQKGEMLDTSYTPVAFNKMSGGQTFKKNIGLGLYAGVSVFKPIGERTEIFAEPYIRYNISNMTKEKTPFTQKFNVAGINFGVRYKLSGNGQRSYGR